MGELIRLSLWRKMDFLLHGAWDILRNWWFFWFTKRCSNIIECSYSWI